MHTKASLTSGVGSRGLRYPDARDAGKPSREWMASFWQVRVQVGSTVPQADKERRAISRWSALRRHLRRPGARSP